MHLSKCTTCKKHEGSHPGRKTPENARAQKRHPAHKNASAPKYIKMRQKTPGEKTPNLFAHYFSTAVTLHVPGLGYEK
jgi:hypothetical protein